MRNFLWGGHEDKRKCHLVSWKQVCLPTCDGGLGIWTIKEVNDALLSKWLWRLGTEGDFLWKMILIHKYSVRNLKWEINHLPHRASGMWKATTVCVDKLKEEIRFKVGSGNKVKFWTEPWCDSSSLATRFPSLYRLS